MRRPAFYWLVLLILALVGSEPRAASRETIGTAFQWNSATLQGIRDAKLGAPMAARALAIVHTCMYDAWAAYDEHAFGTQLRDALRRPLAERTLANKEQATSYAAYRALTDILPVDQLSVYAPLMKQLGYDPSDNSTDIDTATGIGNVACAAVLEYRHHDRANQLGDLAQGVYSDWTGYSPANTPSPVPVRGAVADPNRWQPLVYVNATGDLVSQRFLAPQWCYVAPFALAKGDELRAALDSFAPRGLRLAGIHRPSAGTGRPKRKPERPAKGDRGVLAGRSELGAAPRPLVVVRRVDISKRPPYAGRRRKNVFYTI